MNPNTPNPNMGMGAGTGRGMGRGMGMGRGRGLGQAPGPAKPPASAQDELSVLKQEATDIGQRLKWIEQRIRELESGEKTQG